MNEEATGDARQLKEEPSVNLRFKKHPVVVGIFIAAITCLIVHALFSVPIIYDYLEVKADAGDVLVYIGTVSVALVAVWQNQKLQESSEVMQKEIQRMANKQQRNMRDIERIRSKLNLIAETMEEYKEEFGPARLYGSIKVIQMDQERRDAGKPFPDELSSIRLAIKKERGGELIDKLTSNIAFFDYDYDESVSSTLSGQIDLLVAKYYEILDKAKKGDIERPAKDYETQYKMVLFYAYAFEQDSLSIIDELDISMSKNEEELVFEPELS